MAYREEWAEFVREAMGQRGHRQLARALDVHHSYIGLWLHGRVPSRAKVITFARVTGPKDAEPRLAEAWVNRALIAAGYAPETELWDPDAAFTAGIRALGRELGRDLIISTDDLALAGATPEQVAAALAAVKERTLARVDRASRPDPPPGDGPP